MKKKILVLAAHPDDETIGCGGTILKHILSNDKVFCIYFTDGVGARKNKNNKKEINERKKSAKKAEKILGFRWMEKYCGFFPDNELDKVSLLKIIKIIEKIKKIVSPDIIYTHCPYDLNIDHQKIAEATITAFRPQDKEKWKKILTYEIPSSTDYAYHKNKKNFSPNYFVDISKYWLKKKKALLAYKRELKKFPNSRSLKGIENLANFRGSQNGLKKAEAFQIIKSIDR